MTDFEIGKISYNVPVFDGGKSSRVTFLFTMPT